MRRLSLSETDGAVSRKIKRLVAPNYSRSYPWLEIRVEQHVSVGVNGKVVAIGSKLPKEKGEIYREMNYAAARVPNTRNAV